MDGVLFQILYSRRSRLQCHVYSVTFVFISETNKEMKQSTPPTRPLEEEKERQTRELEKNGNKTLFSSFDGLLRTPQTRGTSIDNISLLSVVFRRKPNPESVQRVTHNGSKSNDHPSPHCRLIWRRKITSKPIIIEISRHTSGTQIGETRQGMLQLGGRYIGHSRELNTNMMRKQASKTSSMIRQFRGWGLHHQLRLCMIVYMLSKRRIYNCDIGTIMAKYTLDGEQEVRGRRFRMRDILRLNAVVCSLLG